MNSAAMAIRGGRVLFGAAMALVLTTHVRAWAASVQDLASYTGPDRTQMLIDGAKKEGVVTLYTSLAIDDANTLTAAFELKFGVKVRIWRASTEDILQRAIVENRASRNDSDLFETDANGLEGLRREGLLQPVQSPAFADLMPQAIKPEGWVASRLNIITGAFNTSAVNAEDVPKTYDELLNPKWKGKLGIEAGDTDWFATVVSSYGEERGLKLFRNIMSTNGASVRKGHTLIANLVASSEIPLALTTYLFKVNQLKSVGAPIQPFQLEPTVARVSGIGLSPSAPHPYGALLFLDFMLTDAQFILANRDFFPTSLKARKQTNEMNISFIDPAVMIDDGDKWEKLFNEIVIRQSR
jgi:iron(III) transport system substrate-binding protein